MSVRRQSVAVEWELGGRSWAVCPEEAIPSVEFVRVEDADVVGCSPPFVKAGLGIDCSGGTHGDAQDVGPEEALASYWAGLAEVDVLGGDSKGLVEESFPVRRHRGDVFHLEGYIDVEVVLELRDRGDDEDDSCEEARAFA